MTPWHYANLRLPSSPASSFSTYCSHLSVLQAFVETIFSTELRTRAGEYRRLVQGSNSQIGSPLLVNEQL